MSDDRLRVIKCEVFPEINFKTRYNESAVRSNPFIFQCPHAEVDSDAGVYCGKDLSRCKTYLSQGRNEEENP
tara:strand:- start:884 stop:1099 length:216 start_codon:yes stop_codon:yes gene_type:complete